MRAARKKFEQRAAREALMGPVRWFCSSSGLGAGRRLADVVAGLPTSVETPETSEGGT